MDYREIIEQVADCIAVYEAVDGGSDFIFREFNSKAEKTEHISREEVLGKSIKDVFPGVVEFGLFEVLKRVYVSGKKESFPLRFYKDERIEGWRESEIMKMSSGHLLVTYRDLTDIKKHEELLKMNEARFREFIELLPEMVCEADLEGKILIANKNAFEKFQLTRADLDSGTTLDQLFVKKDLLRAFRHMKYKMEGREVPPEEYTVKRKDGITFPVLTYFSVSKEKENQGRIRGVMIDISEWKKHEKELEQEKAYLEQLISGAPEAIVQCTGTSTIKQVNNEFTRLFGYTMEEAEGQDIDLLLTREKMRDEAKSITKYVSEGNRIYKESTRYHKDGRPINVSILGTPVMLNNKQIGVYGIYRDITERKKTEQIQQLTNNISTAVLTSNSLDHLLDIIWKELNLIIDTTNLFIAFYDKEKDTLSFPFFADEKDKFENINAKKTITKYVINSNRPVLLNTKDLEKLEKAGEIDLVGSPSKIWLGVPLHILGEVFGVISLQSYDDDNAFTEDDLDVLVFISNQISLAINKIKAEEDLKFAKLRAEEAALAKEQFLSTMSHEIRTPLNAVIGMSQLLMGMDPRPDQQEFLNALKFSGENLMVIINDILDYNKLEAGKVELERVPINLRELSMDIVKVLMLKAKERQNTIEVNVEDDVPTEVFGDRVRLSQILTNLIGNAIKFTEKGTIVVRISIETEVEAYHSIRFEVEDTGIGISKEKIGLIFESFTQAKSDITRKFGGSGLGLAITKKLIELQGGNISVESTPKKGSKFIFTLPYKKKKQITKARINAITEPSPEIKGKKILVVEDNEINRLVARKFLEGWGLMVDEAENGKIAIDRIKKNHYDLIIMDLQMPVMDGYKSTRIIKTMEQGKYAHLPIVALTASILVDVKSKVLEAGLDDYLIKPFNALDLQKMITTYLLK